MSLTGWFDRDVTIVRSAVEVDEYGNTTRDFDPVASYETVKGWVAQTTGIEILDGRTAEVTTWEALLPAGTDVTAVDRVVCDSVTYELDGPPNHVRRPRRGEWYVHARLRRVDG